jgi:hypothetical protein
MVPGFFSGRISGVWLYLKENSGPYCLGTQTWVVDKAQWRYICNKLPEDINKIIYEW